MNKIKIWMGVVVLIVLAVLVYQCQGTPSQTELLGKDQNGNGVWDDVEEKIVQKFGYSNNTKNAMFQMARAVQKAASEPNMTKQRALEIAVEDLRSEVCMEQVEPTFIKENLLIEAWVVNSRDRIKIYNHYNALLSGEVPDKGPDTDMCDFQVEQ